MVMEQPQVPEAFFRDAVMEEPQVSRPRKRVLEDVTNTPSPLGMSFSSGGPLAASNGRRSYADVAVVAARPVQVPAAAAVQRFSLLSRRAGSSLGPQQQASPGHPVLHLPSRMPERPGSPVALCPCSWREKLVRGQRRLCQQDTEDHREYQLLEAMSRRFAAERGGAFFCGAEVAGVACAGAASTADRASRRELEVFFIVVPGSETAVGYAAFWRSPGDGTGCGSGKARSGPARSQRETVTIAQLYVEPEYRCRGLAAAALRVLLAGCARVCLLAGAQVPTSIDSPEFSGEALAGKVLSKLGFDAVVGGGEESQGGSRSALHFRRRRKLRSSNCENCTENSEN